MKKIHFQEFADLCMSALELLRTEEDLKRLANPVTEDAIGKMLYYFEEMEDYETCQDIQEMAIAIFDRPIQPTIVQYETTESEA